MQVNEIGRLKLNQITPITLTGAQPIAVAQVIEGLRACVGEPLDSGSIGRVQWYWDNDLDLDGATESELIEMFRLSALLVLKNKHQPNFGWIMLQKPNIIKHRPSELPNDEYNAGRPAGLSEGEWLALKAFRMLSGRDDRYLLNCMLSMTELWGAYNFRLPDGRTGLAWLVESGDAAAVHAMLSSSWSRVRDKQDAINSVVPLAPRIKDREMIRVLLHCGEGEHQYYQHSSSSSRK